LVYSLVLTRDPFLLFPQFIVSFSSIFFKQALLHTTHGRILFCFCFLSHAEQSYRYVLAGGWGNPLALLSTPWTLATIAPLTALGKSDYSVLIHSDIPYLVAFLVQLFYSWRIWVISHGQKRFIPILAIIVLVSFFLCFFLCFVLLLQFVN
jgi:hypothetical protein